MLNCFFLHVSLSCTMFSQNWFVHGLLDVLSFIPIIHIKLHLIKTLLYEIEILLQIYFYTPTALLCCIWYTSIQSVTICMYDYLYVEFTQNIWVKKGQRIYAWVYSWFESKLWHSAKKLWSCLHCRMFLYLYVLVRFKAPVPLYS